MPEHTRPEPASSPQAVREQLVTHPETASGEFDLPLLAVTAMMRLRV